MSGCFSLEFEGIEVHSRKIFNVVKEKASPSNATEESAGPMVGHYVTLFRSICLLGPSQRKGHNL